MELDIYEIISKLVHHFTHHKVYSGLSLLLLELSFS